MPSLKVALGGLLGVIISVSVGAYIYGAIFPGAASSVSNTTNWGNTPTAVITIGTTVFLIILVVAVVMHVLGGSGLGGD